MQQEKNSELYEPIEHITASAPYAIHYTRQKLGYEPTIYLHWHDEMEFLLMEQGDILFQIEDKTYTLHEGDGIFVPSGLLHSARSLSDKQPIFYAFVFSPGFISSHFDARLYNKYILPVMHNNFPYALMLNSKIEWHKKILEHLHDIFHTEKAGELYIRGLTLLIWDLLYQHHIDGLDTNKAMQGLSAQLSPAFTFMHDNYHQNITLKEIASCVYLSESEFCRAFKQLTGMTAFHYLIRYRVLQSCNELLQTNKKIADIALSCGFNNISYYNRAFIKIMNMTPSAFRKDMHSEST